MNEILTALAILLVLTEAVVCFFVGFEFGRIYQRGYDEEYHGINHLDKE